MMAWDNQAIAEKLQELADLLEQQAANPFRVSAYRRAARTVSGYEEPLADLAEREGIEGLDRLPGIGRARYAPEFPGPRKCRDKRLARDD